MSGLDEAAYQITSFAMFCEGVQGENADQLRVLLADLDKARTYETYEEYLHYREVLDAFVDISPKRQRLLDILAEVGASGAMPEEAWLENDPENEDWWNPAEVLEQIRIPVLAIFGDRDSNGDPIQGAYAWRKALEQAGDPNFQVEILPGVNHFMLVSESTCIEKQLQAFNQAMARPGAAVVVVKFVNADLPIATTPAIEPSVR